MLFYNSILRKKKLCNKTAVGSILKGSWENTDIWLQHKVAFCFFV